MAGTRTMEIPGMATVGMMTNTLNTAKLRHEIKYQITRQQAFLLSQRLEKLMSRDTNSGSRGIYRVSSLYFDDPYDRALREKVNGTDKRVKFRIRYYGYKTDFIRLEKKIKQRDLCLKLQAGLTEQECIRIINGETDFLFKKDDELSREFYIKLRSQLLRPSCIVSYDREAFIYGPGNVRVTLDLGLRVCRDPKRFFDSTRYDLPMDWEGMGVLEVKYDEFLPEIVALMLKGYCGVASSNSKYALSRRLE